jgi:hypothetical protein
MSVFDLTFEELAAIGQRASAGAIRRAFLFFIPTPLVILGVGWRRASRIPRIEEHGRSGVRSGADNDPLPSQQVRG